MFASPYFCRFTQPPSGERTEKGRGREEEEESGGTEEERGARRKRRMRMMNEQERKLMQWEIHTEDARKMRTTNREKEQQWQTEDCKKK